jgi:hypothetical protein
VTSVSDFTEQEQELLYTSPWVVGLAVASADPGGTLRETFAIAGIVSTAVERYPGNALIASLRTAHEGGAGAAGHRPDGGAEPTRRTSQDGGAGALPGLAVDACRRVSAALEARAEPEEADGFRRFLADVALAVAEAADSGGMLGIGGVRDLEPLPLDAGPGAGPRATADPPDPAGEPIHPE